MNVCQEQGRLCGRHWSPHDGPSQVERSNVTDAILIYYDRLQSHSAESLWPRPGWTSGRAQTRALTAIGAGLSGFSIGTSRGQADQMVEDSAGLQDRTHGDGEPSCKGDGRALEANPFSELHRPITQTTLGAAAR